MPKDTPLSQDRVGKDISTKCQHHSNKMVEYYCPSHDVLGCSTCFLTVHKKCDAAESVYDKSESVLESQEYKEFTKKLAATGQKSNDLTKRTRGNVAMLETCCRNTISDIRALKEEVIAIFEEMEQTLVTQVETISSNDKESMEQFEKKLMKTKTAVDELRIELGELAKSKRVCQLYIRMKEKKSEASLLEDKLRTTEKGINFRPFEFEPNNDIKNLVRTSGLGKIVHVDNTQTGNEVTPVKNDKNTTATHVTDIYVKADSDTVQCIIYGSVVLSETLLVIADYNNKKVKLIDTNVNKLDSELHVSGNPFDVAKINENLVCVSLQGGGMILIIKVTDSLSLYRHISVSRDCRGVAYSMGELLVTFYNSNRIDFIDLQGNIIKKLENSIFKGRRHVCVSPAGDSIYLPDFRTNKALRLTFNGEIKSEYKMSNPHKICTDHCNNVYVAADTNKSVHMLTTDCVKIKEVLTVADGLEDDVTSVSHCASTNRLYVGMWRSNAVKVYQLS